MIYIFDVDGTLTPSRAKIDPHFSAWFEKWVDFQQQQRNEVWLISGSDLPKTIEQMGINLVNKIDRCYNCMGNTLYQNGKTVYEHEFVLTYELRDYLKTQLEISPYPHRYGAHIEQRPGMINFSIVGRGAVGEQRTHYYNWDQKHCERERIAHLINKRFVGDKIVAQVGGETGLDIAIKGRDKRQIIPAIKQPAVFFGDNMESPNGNDYPLRAALECVKNFNHVSHQVDGYIDTLRILQTNYM